MYRFRFGCNCVCIDISNYLPQQPCSFHRYCSGPPPVCTNIYIHMRVHMDICIAQHYKKRARSSVLSKMCDMTCSCVWHDTFWSPEVSMATNSEPTVCCNVLQCVAVCDMTRSEVQRSILQLILSQPRVAVCCSVKDDTLKSVSLYNYSFWINSVLQCVVVCCNVREDTLSDTLLSDAILVEHSHDTLFDTILSDTQEECPLLHCNTLQQIAAHCWLFNTHTTLFSTSLTLFFPDTKTTLFLALYINKCQTTRLPIFSHLFWENVGLSCRNVGLFGGHTGLSCKNMSSYAEIEGSFADT